MSVAYKSAREHLEDQIQVVTKLVERQINAHWEAGILPRIKDEFSGTFVSGGEVGALLKGGNAPTAKGVERLEELDRQIRTKTKGIEIKLAENRKQGSPLPFDQLRSTFGLTPTEQRVLWILLVIEISARLRQLMRYLVNEASRIHADIGLLEILVYSSTETRDRMIVELAPDGRLFKHRLVEFIGSQRQIDDAPFLLRPVKVAPRLIELVHGVVRLDPKVASFASLIRKPPGLDQLIVSDELKTEVTQLLGPSKAPGPGPVVLMSGAEGTGRKAMALGAAAEHGYSVLHVRCDDLPTDSRELPKAMRALIREAILFRAMPLFENIDVLPGEPETGRPDRSKHLDKALNDFLGPAAGTCGLLDTRPIALGRGLVVVDLDIPSEARRRQLWQRVFGQQKKIDMDNIAARYPISGGVILKSAAAARSLAEARSEPTGVTDHDVHAGLRSTLDSKLSNLGNRVQWRQTWDDLVLPDDSIEEIYEFMARVKHRRQVYDDWGFSRKMAKGLGLSALFAGPPGTGKTMVAGLIAHELSLDLYQIDLSRIVSKYVGETEKNLAELFDAAEAGHAILLFDEADSLFAKRTEVKSSVDRYANLEVNYLLQRMEGFSGITILTTNLDSSIDDAFRRRISFKVDFPFPEPEDRERLWETMLPDEATTDGDIDFGKLASRYEMSGGYIRNAVLRAAFLAAADESAITMSHMMRAANLEYQAMGKVISHFSR
ncbi:MAG: ATP-binding protein [Deltaproteobacteria bacterium]|nr:ATP-binding protein [Deltaproteobacteria bacterium]